MSLIKMAEFAKPENQLAKPQRGEVIDNEDPKKLGRVKVKIKGMIEGDRENIPWTYPRNPNLHGGTPKASGHAVPEIGSNLVIDFPHGNIYQAYYKSTWHSKDNFVKKTFDNNYPHKYGWQDAGGNNLTQDKVDGSLEYNHMAEYKKKDKLPGTYGDNNGAEAGDGGYDDVEDDEGGGDGGDGGGGGETASRRLRADEGGDSGGSGGQQQKKPKLNMKVEKDGTLNVSSEAKMNIHFKKDISVESDTQIYFKSKKIILDGDVLLGGKDAKRELALKDSVDSNGDKEVGNLSQKVKAI